MFLTGGFMGANSPFRQPSNQVSRFAQVPQAQIERSSFQMRHTNKGQAASAGLLVPMALYEVLPGDTFKFNPTLFVRLTTQVVPLMDNLYCDTFWFFCPNRLVWDNWQRFMGERDPDPDSSIDYTIPQLPGLPTTGWQVGSLPDAFGVPIFIADKPSVSALPFRMYHLIWNSWFRDQNIQDSVVVDLDNGPDTPSDYNDILRRGKRHDYFTSCLPEPQKGDGVDLPLGTVAPVKGIGKADQSWDATPATVYETGESASSSFAAQRVINSAGGANTTFYVEEDPDNTGFPGIFADLSQATAASINTIREAFQIQRLLERDARGGTRYIELIRAHFGVTSPDARLQRPEFLGGTSVPFNQQAVAQTTYQGTETRLDAKGSLAANSVFVSRGSITYSAVEHGYIMGIFNVRSDITYQQGLDRHWSRLTRYDFYWPAFAHLGEQAVISRELYCDGSGSASADPPTGDFSIFGYQERYGEMRQIKSLITGTLRSVVPTTLDYFHLSEEFGGRPTLSEDFIEDNPPIDRVVGISPAATTPAFLYDLFVDGVMVRPMPAYGVPGMMDHF